MSAAVPVSAQTCDGKPATIVGSGDIIGTPGRDVIVGSNDDDFINGKGGRDIICGRKGDDTIEGRGRRDRIFGGSGDDIILGGPGPDDLFGYAGNDFIDGNGSNDFINGGTGTDDCDQGKGVGPVKNCEKADLKIKIVGPGNISFIHDVQFVVKVRNRGPDAAAYALILDQFTDGLSCDPKTDWDGKVQEFKKLGPKRTRKRTYATDCMVQSNNSWVEIVGDVDNYATDTKPDNNIYTERAIWAD
jgi:hypothetical protein